MSIDKATITPQLKKDFTDVAYVIRNLKEAQLNALKLPNQPEDFDGSPKELAMQWLWQTLVVLKIKIPEIDIEAAMRQIHEGVMNTDPNLRFGVLMNEHQRNRQIFEKDIDQQTLAEIPDIPEELREACNFE